MTQNQSSLLVKNPNTKKAVAVLKRYAEMEAQLKKLAKEADEATATIKEAMIEQGVEKVTFDPELTGIKGYITLAERVGYKADDLEQVDEKYLKPTLDTAKVKAEVVLTGNLPAGISESRTQYITKKVELVE